MTTLLNSKVKSLLERKKYIYNDNYPFMSADNQSNAAQLSFVITFIYKHLQHSHQGSLSHF